MHLTDLKPLLLGSLLLAAGTSAAAAQTDYYNTDAGRPITIEDAYPVERRAFELQLAPLRLERGGGVYTWAVEPEIAFGFAPRTHLELGVPLVHVDGPPGTRTTGVAGIELSLFHNLNTETAIPALAVAGDVILPVGALAPARTYASAKGIMTKTFRAARFHVNGQYTFGAEPAAEGAGHELSRWLGGIAVDRTFPLRAMLVTAEVVARQPIHAADAIGWQAATGLRYQYSPRLALDGGIGRDLTGDDRTWFVTFGSAYAFGLPWHPRR